MTLARAVARAMETGAWDGALARNASRLVGAWQREAFARTLAAPPGTRVIGTSGATLGGSWKTPCAIAITKALAARGERVAFVAHGYRARGPDDLGDEGEVAKAALASSNVAVITRKEMCSREAGGVDVFVCDGLTRGALRRQQTHVLCLDAERPFGSGRCPPAGDLRAPIDALFRASALRLSVADVRANVSKRDDVATFDLVLPELVRTDRIALVTALARPDRLRSALARRDVVPSIVRELPDHGSPRDAAALSRELSSARFDVVLATEKCARSLGASLAGRPVARIGLDVTLPSSFLAALG